MRLSGGAQWKVTFLAALVAGCGGGAGAARPADAARSCDGGCPPPAAQIAWDHAVLTVPKFQGKIAGMVVLPTGIAILAPPAYVLLADKTDGHFIARTSWPTEGNLTSSAGPAIARKNGDLAILTQDSIRTGPNTSSVHLAVREYAGADLAPVKTTVVNNIGGPVLGELSGELYVLLSGTDPSVDAVYLYALSDGGSVQTQMLATGSAAANAYGTFAVSPGGGLLTCGTFFEPGQYGNSGQYGPAAVLRINPPKTLTKALTFGGIGTDDCRLFAGPDRDLVTWHISGQQSAHWDIVSTDGTNLVADTHGPFLGASSTAYGEGAFASVKVSYASGNGAVLYVADPDTAVVRGPYAIPLAATYSSLAIAGEGDSLWIAYDDGNATIRLAKLGPLPK